MDSANEACETAATEAAAEASADTAAAVRVRTSVLFGEDTKNRDGSVVMIGNDAWVASIPAEEEGEVEPAPASRYQRARLKGEDATEGRSSTL